MSTKVSHNPKNSHLSDSETYLRNNIYTVYMLWLNYPEWKNKVLS